VTAHSVRAGLIIVLGTTVLVLVGYDIAAAWRS
jgi:hypothetical protein